MSEIVTSGPRHQQTLCWDCENATGGCSWADHGDHTPVKGWDAIRTRIKTNRFTDEYAESYIVLACPEFVRDGEGFGLFRPGEQKKKTPAPRVYQPNEAAKRIIEEYKSGASISEIKERTQKAGSVIYRVLRAAGIKAERQRGPKKKMEEEKQ